MTVTEFIDEILAYSDNVASAGADYADRRQRILYFLIREASATYYAREWYWRLKDDDTVTIPANQGYGLLPADFLQIGKLGHVYNKSQGGVEVFPAAESEVADLLAMGTVSTPNIYALFGLDDSDPPRKKIWMPKSGSLIQLHVFYHPKMPTLDEGAGNNNLNDACPVEYQETVLIPGVQYRARRSKSDTRRSEDLAMKREGLRDMKRNNRRFQGGEQRLPSFFGY
jgi:hypothetical protein